LSVCNSVPSRNKADSLPLPVLNFVPEHIRHKSNSKSHEQTLINLFNIFLIHHSGGQLKF